MKINAIVIAAGLFVATTATAAPYYVGENLSPRDNINLGFKDSPTKKAQSLSGADTGNIAAIDLEGAYNVIPNLALEGNLPFYMINKNATTSNQSRTSLGNIALGGTWSKLVSSTTEEVQWGYSLAMDIYLPTSRKTEAAGLANAQPTTEFFRYATKTWTTVPTAGLFFDMGQVEAKGNAGFGYSRVASSAAAGDKSRLNFNGQLGLSYSPVEEVAMNLEYNSIAMDAATAGTGKRFRHALAPSVSGEWNEWFGAVNAAIPLDKTTRDISAVAFGLDVGYLF